MDPDKLLFPPHCVFCGAATGERIGVCEGCISRLARLMSLRCRNCGKEIGSCECYGSLTFLFWYREKDAVNAMFRIKENAEPSFFNLFAGLLSKKLENNYDAVTYVPRSADGLRRFGYDQSRYLAESYGRLTGIPVIRAFDRNSIHGQQKLLDSKQRKAAVKNTFSVRNGDICGYKNLLLLDDVVTTGTTITECAKLLKTSEGVKSVACASIAKTNISSE